MTTPTFLTYRTIPPPRPHGHLLRVSRWLPLRRKAIVACDRRGLGWPHVSRRHQSISVWQHTPWWSSEVDLSLCFSPWFAVLLLYGRPFLPVCVLAAKLAYEFLWVVASFEATFETFCCSTGSGGCWAGCVTAGLDVAGGPSVLDNDEVGLVGSDGADGGSVRPDDVAGVAWEGDVADFLLCLFGGSGSKDQNVRKENEELALRALTLLLLAWANKWCTYGANKRGERRLNIHSIYKLLTKITWVPRPYTRGWAR